MARRNAPEIFFPRHGAAHGHAQEPAPGSAVKIWGQSVRKNRPLVPRSNIAGSWAQGGEVGPCEVLCFALHALLLAPFCVEPF